MKRIIQNIGNAHVGALEHISLDLTEKDYHEIIPSMSLLGYTQVSVEIITTDASGAPTFEIKRGNGASGADHSSFAEPVTGDMGTQTGVATVGIYDIVPITTQYISLHLASVTATGKADIYICAKR